MATKKSASDNHTDIRIGISDSSHELTIVSDLSQDDILGQVTKALESQAPLVLVDVKGRKTVVPTAKVSFVEIGESYERRVGFATI